jgi:hypothetical protein
MKINDYYKTARENESVFRNILRDINSNGQERPYNLFIPETLETELPLEEIFQKYSKGLRFRKFTITDFFSVADRASIFIQRYNVLSEEGCGLAYIINRDNSVKYVGVLPHLKK